MQCESKTLELSRTLERIIFRDNRITIRYPTGSLPPPSLVYKREDKVLKFVSGECCARRVESGVLCIEKSERQDRESVS